MSDTSGNTSAFSDDRVVVLKDGRTLGYLTSGPQNGIPIFFFHGTPGSRLSFTADDRIALLPGVFMIFPERPGYGLSTPKSERTLTGWSDDIVELADQLGIDRYAVAGGSGGGPHALACAWKNPERVFAAYLFGSPTPVESLSETKGMAMANRLNFYIGTRMPWLVRFLMKQQASTVKKNPDKFIRAVAKQMSPADRKIVEDERFQATIIKDLQEAYRQGWEAQFIDGQLMMSMRPWGFSLSEIAVPVHAWYGDQDTLVPATMAAKYSEIPGANVRIVPNVGHLLLENGSGTVNEFENALREEWRRITSS